MTLDMPTTAMVLAAGAGTRLRPLTNSVSKCMVVVRGKPILAHIVDHLRSYGVRDIIMNLHHLPHRIQDYFDNGRESGVCIRYSMEPTLLGTAGALRKVREYLKTPFFLLYGDNLSTCKLDQLYRFHRIRRGLASIALFQRDDPTSSGIVELDGGDRITRFVEKPAPDQIFSRWVNAGIYILEPDILTYVPTDGPSDFGRDVFPAMLASGESLYGYRMVAGEGLWWIDTVEDLFRARRALDGSDDRATTEVSR